MWTAGGVDYKATDGQAKAMWDALHSFAPTKGAKLPLKIDDTNGLTVMPPPQGWVGTYHAAGGNVKDGKNTSAFDIGQF